MDHEWSWSNFLTVLLLVIVAVIEALQQALSQAPAVTEQLPVWVISPNWNYVPLVLLIVAGLLWIVGHLPTKAQQHYPAVQLPPTTVPTTTVPARPQMSQVSGRVFVDLTTQQ